MTTEKKKVILPLHMANELMDKLLLLYCGVAANLGARHYNEQDMENVRAEGSEFARNAFISVVTELEKHVPIEVRWIDTENIFE